jgi:hypothetical protein
MYLVNNDKLLLLEEINLRIMDCNGNILKSTPFRDLIEDCSIDGNILSLKIYGGENEVIDLSCLMP